MLSRLIKICVSVCLSLVILSGVQCINSSAMEKTAKTVTISNYKYSVKTKLHKKSNLPVDENADKLDNAKDIGRVGKVKKVIKNKVNTQKHK